MSGATRHAEVIVVGGGQAGMAAGYYLSRAGIGLLILDAGSRAGEAWRQRWDTLELFTPARYSSLPGMRFPGSPGHYPGKDEVAGYLHAYARAFALPVHYNTRVTALEHTAGGYRLNSSAGRYEAGQVIVATGAYQQPWTPPIATGLSGEVTQLHSASYRNPARSPASGCSWPGRPTPAPRSPPTSPVPTRSGCPAAHRSGTCHDASWASPSTQSATGSG